MHRGVASVTLPTTGDAVRVTGFSSFDEYGNVMSQDAATRHSGIGYHSPNQFEALRTAALQAA
jgi:hypothetical protein